MHSKAVSLVELLAAVAIIGVLSAVAAPSYRDYVIRTKVTDGIRALEIIKKAFAEKASSTGSNTVHNIYAFGTQISTSAPSANTNLSFGPVETVNWWNLGGGGATGYMRACLYLSGLEGMKINDSLGAYVAASSSTGGQRSMVCAHYQMVNDVVQMQCGIAYGVHGNQGIAPHYLPGHCQCGLVSSPAISCGALSS